MLKMGFYYSGNAYTYYSKYNIGDGYNSYLSYAVDENRIAEFYGVDRQLFQILSEWLVENNIMKLSNTEPSTLIDIHYNDGISGSFSKLNNIEQKLCITFIEEFDRIYTSIEKNSSSNLVQSDTILLKKLLKNHQKILTILLMKII